MLNAKLIWFEQAKVIKGYSMLKYNKLQLLCNYANYTLTIELLILPNFNANYKKL